MQGVYSLGLMSHFSWRSRRQREFAVFFLIAAFAASAHPSNTRAAAQNAGACSAFVRSGRVQLAENVALYLPKSSRTDLRLVAADFRDVLVDMSKLDPRFKTYTAGPVESALAVNLEKWKKWTGQREAKVPGNVSRFSFAKERDGGLIFVCHTGGEKLTIAAERQAAAHIPFLRSVAKSFLKADRIVVEGEQIWPPKKGFKP